MAQSRDHPRGARALSPDGQVVDGSDVQKWAFESYRQRERFRTPDTQSLGIPLN